MSSPYHDGSRSLQDRFDTRRLADRLDEKFLSRPTIDADDRAFIERMDMFFLATADADGRPQCSYKGGDPGFVRVLDERTVAFPNYDGNGMYLSMGNLLVEPARRHAVHRLRLRAAVTTATQRHREHRRTRRADRPVPWRTVHRPGQSDPGVPELPAIHPPDGARRTIAIRATPRPGNTVPGLEKSDWACDVLPRSDPARRH